MTTIDKTKPVMITGATGYVAGWIVKKLLDEGFTVHAPIRNPENPDSTRYLNAMADKSKGKIIYFKADLLVDGSYDEAMRGCEIVFHTASPFITKVKDAQRDLVNPALLGTRNVLASANRTPSVKRVVLTSSIAAIVGDAKDTLNYHGGKATEKHWNTSSSLKHQAYSFSKTVAEKAAWEICQSQGRWDLVVINPGLVMGPGINPHSTSESYRLVSKLGSGVLRFGAPDFSIGVVDVRDLASAHFNAAFNPEASGRYIVLAEETSFLKLSEILRKKYGNAYPFPKNQLPKLLVWLLAPATGFSRKMIRRNVGYRWNLDNTKSIDELSMKYRPVSETIVEYFKQMIDNEEFE